MGIIFLIWLILTLAQATTFSGIWELEKGFVKGVIESPSAWLGTVALWKSAVLALAILVVLVELLVWAFAALIRVCLCKHCKRVPKAIAPATSVRERAIKKETSNNVVMSNRTVTKDPRKFTRVHRNK